MKWFTQPTGPLVRAVFAYSDVAHKAVMRLSSRALACGADFVLLGPESTYLESRNPVVAVTAARTGSGKSPPSRWVVERQRMQRFASTANIVTAGCTAEEREEYEAHVAAGSMVFAGVDYATVLASAEAESDAIVWDGGNNDFSFFRPDDHIAVLDALRGDQATAYHPGEAVTPDGGHHRPRQGR